MYQSRMLTTSSLSHSSSSFHDPSSSQSNAIIITTTPYTREEKRDADSLYVPSGAGPSMKQTASSFAGFIDRNSECTDLVGLTIACIIFLVAQTVLIAVWYYLYVKIKWQRRSLSLAIAAHRVNLHHPQSPDPHFPPSPPSQMYGVFNPNTNPNSVHSNPVHHQFGHHLLLPATHHIQQHHRQTLLAQQEQYMRPIEVRTQFDGDQVYASPATIYTGTVIRHRIGSMRPGTRRGFGTASRLTTFGTKRRSLLKRTLRTGNLRRSGGFHYYPKDVFLSPTKLLASDHSQDESGKSRVYEVLHATSSGQEEENIATSGQHGSVVRGGCGGQRDKREFDLDHPGTRSNNNNNGSKRNLFHNM